MTEQDTFGLPDREGFEKLLLGDFVLHKRMLFRGSTFDADYIDARLLTQRPDVVQRELNHTPLFLYAADIRIQRDWCIKLEAKWKERLEREFPNLQIHFARSDNDQEVILTLWTQEVRQS